MDDVHKAVLREMMAEIMGQISDPDTLASCLTVLTPMDKEAIERRTKNAGDRKGTEELLNRLMKRGCKAFDAFLKQLRKLEHSELAGEIQRKVDKKINPRPFHSTPAPSHSSSFEISSTREQEDDDTFPETNSLQRSNTGPPSLGYTPLVRQQNVIEPDIKPETVALPLESSHSKLSSTNSVAPIRSSLQMNEVQEVQQYTKQYKEINVELPAKQFDTTAKPSTVESSAHRNFVVTESLQERGVSINTSPSHLQMDQESQERCTEEGNCAKRESMLLKKIPEKVKIKVCRMLNHYIGQNWRDVAGAMGLTFEQTNEYDIDGPEGKMDGLFNRMVHQGKTVSDLVLWLNHEDVTRLDVIDVFREEGLISPALENQLRGPDVVEEKESKSPLPCTDEKTSFFAGSPVFCSEDQQTVSKPLISQREMKKGYQQQSSPPCGKESEDFVANGDTIPQSPITRQRGAGKNTSLSNVEEPSRETLLSYKGQTTSSLPPLSPTANNFKEDLETDSPTQCTDSSKRSQTRQSRGAYSSSNTCSSASPMQCTSLNVVASATNSATPRSFILKNDTPTQCSSLTSKPSKEKANSAKTANAYINSNSQTECTSLNSSTKEASEASSATVEMENAVDLRSGNAPTQCTSLKSSTKEASEASSATVEVENAVDLRSGNAPMQCTSLNSSTKEASEASSATVEVENAVDLRSGNAPTQCTSLKSSTKEASEASSATVEVENAVDLRSGNAPTQCTSLKSSTKEASEASSATVEVENAVDLRSGNAPTQCTSLKSSTKEASEASSATVEVENAVDLRNGNVPTHCSSVCFRSPTEDSTTKKTVGLSEGSSQVQYGNLNTTASSAVSVTPTQCTSLNVAKSAKTPVEEEADEKPISSPKLDIPGGYSCTEDHKENCCSPVSCTDVEKSKDVDVLGNAYDEHVKVRDLDNNVQSSPVDDETNEEDVSCSDKFGRSALVICCERYQNLTPLDGLSHHANELSKLLQEAGWSVSTALNCSTAEIQNVFEEFLQTIGSGKSKACLVFLIGHTVQIHGVNYLLPVDVSIRLNRADVVHKALSLNSVLNLLEEKSYLHIVFVDGAHENKQPLQCYGAFPGLASVYTPPNCVVALPCNPGVERSSKERLVYIECLIKQLRSPGLTLRDVLTNVAEAMKDAKIRCTSVPCTLSMTPSLVPFCIVTPGNETQVSSAGPVGIQVPPKSIPKRAIIICNCRYVKNSLPTSIYTDAHQLKHALDKAHWTVTYISDRNTAGLTKAVREFLDSIRGERGIVMVYFIGFAQQIRGRNWLFGIDWTDQREISRYAFTTQWLLDLMCELVSGPRILVVDDMNTSGPDGLVSLSVPQETLVSLPCAREMRCHSVEEEQNSFSHESGLLSTLGSYGSYIVNWFWGTVLGNKSPDMSYSHVLAQRLEANPERSLKEILSMQGHKVEKNLFFA